MNLHRDFRRLYSVLLEFFSLMEPACFFLVEMLGSFPR